MKKKMLASAIFMAVASVGFVMSASAEEHMSTDVAPVLVEGQQEVLPGGLMVASDRVGILGDMKAVEVPFTERQYSQKTLEMFENPNQPMNGVLANNPSIVITSTNGLTTDFSMRGVNMNANHYAINNVPNQFSQSLTMPMHVMESVDITSGPNTVLNGATFSVNGTNGNQGAPGRVNGTTKKATDKDITKYIQKFSGGSTYTEGIEVGRRLGKDKEWGVLVNARKDKGGTAVHGGDVDNKSVYINIDHKSNKSKTNLFGGYYDWHVDGSQRWLQTSGITQLPKVGDLKQNISFDGQYKEGRGYLMTLNHDQKFSEKWSAFTNMGYGYYNQRYNDFGSAAPVMKNGGLLTAQHRDYKQEQHSGYMQFGFANDSQIGNLKNKLSVAYDYSNYRSRNASTSVANVFGGSIYDGILTDTGARADSGSLSAKKWLHETATAVTIADRVEIGKASLFGAAQYRKSDYEAAGTKTVKTNNWNPTFAFAYKPEENMSLYASYSVGFTRAFRVTSTYKNENEIFNPLKIKQKEIGAKYENGGILHTAALFELNQGSYIAEKDPDGGTKDIYTQGGETKFRGFEYYATGKVAPKWNLMGGMMYIKGKLEHMEKANKAYEGNRATGVPRLNFVLATEYEMDGRNSVIGRINAASDSMLGYNNKVSTPGYYTLDLGYKHKLNLGKTDVTLNAMCYNVLGKDYWLARGSANWMTLGAPRTFMVSATFDF